jgi:nucleotide-binding universal stress UspA family protein
LLLCAPVRFFPLISKEYRMYRSLLVPLDGSAFGEQALPLALAIARRANAALEVVHVMAPLASVYAESLFTPDPHLELQVRAHQQEYLDRIVRRLQGTAPVRATATLLDGAPTVALEAHAAACGADLVVMTTHGRGVMGRFWMGSVADYLIRHLALPVLLVHPREEGREAAADPAPRHILLPLDGSPLAEQMIEPAAALGALTGAEITLLRVIRPMLPAQYALQHASAGSGLQHLLDEVEQAHEEVRRQAAAYLEGIASRLQGRGLKVQTRVAVEDQAALAILHEAAPPATDLVALQTHGRGGLSRLLLGSVADKVVRGSAVPVLVQRPPHR